MFLTGFLLQTCIIASKKKIKLDINYKLEVTSENSEFFKYERMFQINNFDTTMLHICKICCWKSYYLKILDEKVLYVGCKNVIESKKHVELFEYKHKRRTPMDLVKMIIKDKKYTAVCANILALMLMKLYEYSLEESLIQTYIYFTSTIGLEHLNLMNIFKKSLKIFWSSGYNKDIENQVNIKRSSARTYFDGELSEMLDHKILNAIKKLSKYIIIDENKVNKIQKKILDTAQKKIIPLESRFEEYIDEFCELMVLTKIKEETNINTKYQSGHLLFKMHIKYKNTYLKDSYCLRRNNKSTQYKQADEMCRKYESLEKYKADFFNHIIYNGSIRYIGKEASTKLLQKLNEIFNYNLESKKTLQYMDQNNNKIENCELICRKKFDNDDIYLIDINEGMYQSCMSLSSSNKHNFFKDTKTACVTDKSNYNAKIQELRPTIIEFETFLHKTLYTKFYNEIYPYYDIDESNFIRIINDAIGNAKTKSMIENLFFNFCANPSQNTDSLFFYRNLLYMIDYIKFLLCDSNKSFVGKCFELFENVEDSNIAVFE